MTKTRSRDILSRKIPAIDRAQPSRSIGEEMPFSSTDTSDFSINDILNILRRRKGIMAACLLVSILAGAAVTLRSPKRYVATSQLVFLRPSYTVLLSDKVFTPPQYEEKSTQVYLLKSKTVAEDTANLLRAENIEISGPQVSAALKIKDVTDTDLMEVSAQMEDPKLAAMVANAAAEAFVAYKRRVRQGNTSTGIEDLGKQMDAARKELARKEQELARFTSAVGFTDVKKASGSLQEQIIGFELQIAKDMVARDEARSRADELAKQVGAQNQAIRVTGILRDNVAIGALQSKLITQETELAAAQQKYTDKYPGTLDDLRRSVADTRARLKKEIDNIVVHNAGNLDIQQEYASKLAGQELEYLAASARYEGLTNVLTELKQRLAGMPKLEMQVLHLMREEAAAEQIYTALLGSHEAAKADRARQTDTVQITELATAPSRPVSPKPMRNMTYALIVGIVLAISAGLLIDRLDDTLHSAEEVKRTLRMPVLGQIPALSGTHQLVTDMHFHSPVSEAYRTLYANISFASIDQPVKTMIITSAVPAEGKSLNAANLAMTIARAGKRVILVEADLRRPAISDLLRLVSARGLTDVLLGRASLNDAVQEVGLPNMLVLASGQLPPNPSETMASQRMYELLDELREAADFVILDTPPCNIVSDTLVLAGKVDAVIQVIDSNSVSRFAAAQAKESLEDARGRLIGCILNRIPMAAHEMYYYYSHADDAEQSPHVGHSRWHYRLKRIFGMGRKHRQK